MKMKNTKLYIKLAYIYREMRWKVKRYNNENMLKDNNKNRVYIFISADYGNLGDIAITYAQKLFLEELLKDYEIIEIPSKRTFEYIKIVKRAIKPNDIITLIGGGNMSNRYDGIEEARRMIVKEFKNNKLISFPQTIEFDNSTYGKLSLERTKKIYSNNNNLILFAREKMSFEIMKELFKSTEVYLTPDIVMYLKGKIMKEDNLRSGIGVCFRNDSEKSIADSLKSQILDIFKNDKKEYFDTYIGNESLVYDARYNDLMNFIKNVASKELVITDRLHGMIFCYITNTPCLVLDNANHKIKSTYNTWLKDCGYIKLIDRKVSIQDINEIKNTNTDINLEDKFDILKEIINKGL